jgi:hypothetical protein
MDTVSATPAIRQAERAEDHPPKRSGRGGPERLEPRVAGGLTSKTNPNSPRAQPVPWHYAKYVSALLAEDADLRQQRRHVRRAQRSVLWDKSRLERVRKCGRVPVDQVTVRSNAGVAHFTGLATCGSIWACPCCSAKIRNVRANEVSAAAAAWHQAGNTVVMSTLTFPHDMGMRLAKLMPVVADGFRSLISGRVWAGTPERHVPERPSKRGGMLPARYYPPKPGMRDQLGVAGTIRSVEVTYGEHGWHPHAHVLVFLHGDSSENIARLAIYLRKRWDAWVVGQGYRAPHPTWGVDVSVCSSAADAGAYIAKTQDGAAVGNELVRADMKNGRDGSRTPFEILDDFRWTGNLEDLALWHEYEAATKGHQAITWSKGLKERLAVIEKTDEEIAAEQVGGEDIAVIPPRVWERIVAIPGLDGAVLDAAETGGLDAINDLLKRHGAGRVRPP